MRPAALNAAGAPSLPNDVAAALVGTPRTAILFAWRTILAATHVLLTSGWCFFRGEKCRSLICGSAEPGCEFRRQRESHVLSNQIQIAVVRESESRKALAHLLHQNLGCGSSRGKTNRLHAFQRRRVNVVCVFDKSRRHSSALRHFHQPI